MTEVLNDQEAVMSCLGFERKPVTYVSSFCGIRCII